jgi:hypothetical protein
MTLEDIKLYLPRYLSEESRNALVDALKNFPIPSERFYTTRLKDTKIIYQGDGLTDLLFINLPESETKYRDGIILSNTCDISPDNKRLFESRMVYAPLVRLSVYRQILEEEGVKKEKIEQHLDSISNHHITQIFFLPGANGILEDSIIFFDRLSNLPSNYIDRETLENRRIFTLSAAGHYLFLFKLSFHFTRMQDKVDRGFS